MDKTKKISYRAEIKKDDKVIYVHDIPKDKEGWGCKKNSKYPLATAIEEDFTKLTCHIYQKKGDTEMLLAVLPYSPLLPTENKTNKAMEQTWGGDRFLDMPCNQLIHVWCRLIRREIISAGDDLLGYGIVFGVNKRNKKIRG